jgi:hypothetical protein
MYVVGGGKVTRFPGSFADYKAQALAKHRAATAAKGAAS